jgi:hypothetical protein
MPELWTRVVAYAGVHGLNELEEQLLASDRENDVDATSGTLCFDDDSDDDGEAGRKRQRRS